MPFHWTASTKSAKLLQLCTCTCTHLLVCMTSCVCALYGVHCILCLSPLQCRRKHLSSSLPASCTKGKPTAIRAQARGEDCDWHFLTVADRHTDALLCWHAHCTDININYSNVVDDNEVFCCCVENCYSSWIRFEQGTFRCIDLHQLVVYKHRQSMIVSYEKLVWNVWCCVQGLVTSKAKVNPVTSSNGRW